MMDKTRLAVVALAALAVSAQAAVGGELDHDRALREVAAGRALPLSEVVAKAQGSFKGRLLGAQLEEDGQGGLVYRLRMLSADGRIAKVTVGASTGAVASVQSASGRDDPPAPRPSEEAGLTGRRAQPQGGIGAPARQDPLGSSHPSSPAPSSLPPPPAAPAHPAPHVQTPPPAGHVLRGAPAPHPSHRPPAPPPKQPGVSKPPSPHLHSSPAQPDRRPPPKDGRPSQPERKPHENSDRRG